MATDDTTLGGYLDDWLERRRTWIRPTTVKHYRQLIHRYLKPHLGDVALTALDRRVIERTYGHLLVAGGRNGRSLAPKTVRHCHTTLRRALEDARVDGLIDDNPADQARPPRHDPDDIEIAELQVWTGQQAAAFLAFVDDHPWRAVWHLALGTGARRGEILGLRWSDVDLEAAEIRIRRALSVVDGVARLLGTKTSRSRVLSIGPTVVDALGRQRREQERQQAAATSWDNRWGLVFTDDAGQPIDPYDVTMVFRDLVRRAPVPVIRLHDLRHCHASLLLAGGVPIKVVSERLGHSTIAMTMDVYGHLLPGMDASAVARFEELLWPDSA